MWRPASRKKEFLAAQQEELERLRVEVDRLSEALQHAVQSLATEEKRAGATSPILVGRLVRTVYTADEDAESEWMGTIKKGDELIGIVRFESAVPGSNYYDETEDRIAIFIDDIRSTKVTLTRVERRASRSASAQRPRYQLDSDEKTEILKRISKDGKPRAASHPRAIV